MTHRDAMNRSPSEISALREILLLCLNLSSLRIPQVSDLSRSISLRTLYILMRSELPESELLRCQALMRSLRLEQSLRQEQAQNLYHPP